MKVSYLSIKNFRGIKSLESYFDSKFVCLIGSGDASKTSILNAIEYTLAPKWNVNFDDSDFYNQDISEPITISVSLTDWNKDLSEVRNFFREGKFGQFIGGLTKLGPIEEPDETSEQCITVQLQVPNSLEPTWHVIKGLETKVITSADRAVFGIGRIDSHLDNNFTWGRNTFLTKLSSGNGDKLNIVLSDIARITKKNNVALDGYKAIAKNIELEAIKMGVKLNSLSPKFDIQKISLAAGALSLHESEVPLRNFGSGSKKLISCAIQSQLNKGNNIALIDELEIGLEPHRIRGLIRNLKDSNQQIITTTHSGVVLRELCVADNELYVCRKDVDGKVSIHSVNEISDLQSCIRSNAEAFLGTKIVVCEGPTEIGCLRALDQLKSKESVPVWTLNTAYYNAGGIGKVKSTAVKLNSLGYEVSVFCDNDTPDQFKENDVVELLSLGINVTHWEVGNSTEVQLFKDIRWDMLPGLFEVFAKIMDTSIKSLMDSVIARIPGLSDNMDHWIESDELRKQLGFIVSGKTKDGVKCKNPEAWFKRMDLAEEVFNYCLPRLTPHSAMQNNLNALWNTIQNGG